jgi:stalled ribosome alternative rescue factor ArfA
MNKQGFSMLIAAPKQRAHRALFDKNLPFQPKVEKSRKAYTRQAKHRNQERY